MVKNPPANTGDVGDTGLIPGLGRSLGGGNSPPTLVFLPGESHGQRSLVDYSPWGHKELDTIEQLSTQVQDLSSSHPPNSTHPTTLPGFIFSRPLITLKHTIYLTYSFVSPHQGVGSLRAGASFTMHPQCFVLFFFFYCSWDSCRQEYPSGLPAEAPILWPPDVNS